MKRLSENQFDLYLRPDSNTNGYGNWFYFKVTYNQQMQAMRSSAQSHSILNEGSGHVEDNHVYRFNIVNMYKKSTLYCVG